MRTCIFCGERAGSREHLWPKWILDMVRPRRIGGFIGLSTGLEFEREFIVRSVCSACNSGWMSDLETANMPVMGPMIDDKSIALYENERGKIAAWALKTAMLMDSVTKAHVPLFYTEGERQALKESWEIPSATLIWMGRYLGRNDIGASSSRVNFRYGSDMAPTRVTTFILGSLLVQIMTMHPPARYRRHNILVTPKNGPWDQLLLEVWPCESLFRLYWPPLIPFDDSKTALDVSTLADRWHVGEQLSLRR